MSMIHHCRGRMGRASVALGLAVASAVALAAGVGVKVDLSSPDKGPFPSDRFTRLDFSQNTFRRVRLPKPDCNARPSDCADIDVLNALDGFNVQPRITVPFTGAIDVNTVNSETVFLINLGDTRSGDGFGQRMGINQVSWNPGTNTLVFESDEQLNEHTRYVLVVTDGVRDATGDPIEAGRWDRFDPDERDARRHVPPARDRIAALSVFTTQSTTADLDKIRDQIKRSQPAPVEFVVGQGPSGPVRAVFPLSQVAAIQFNRQVGTAPVFTTSFLPTPALNVVPGSVAQIAFGKFHSPDYQTADKFIPATPTRTGQPVPQSTNDIHFELFMPAGPKPAGGWPVAIFGHGFTDSMYGAPWAVASVLASRGIATIAINVVGHGGGALGTLAVLRTSGDAVVVPAGGRGIDQDGNGTIDSTEGVNAAPPRNLIGSRDGLRQTVIDLMQLVRQIEVGVDVDGDGAADLNDSRIFYAGQSFGGIYGTILLGVESNIQAGVPNVAGGSIAEVARLGGFRPLIGIALATRMPSLINVSDPSGIAFNENIPLRDQPAVVNDVPGAVEIQKYLDNSEWAQQAGNPVAYAPYIRKHPLRGNAAKPVIFQFAKGDKTVPNPTASAIIRAGDLTAQTTYFRNDLAFAANPAISKNPHTFLTNIASPAGAPFAVGAQIQIAVFFASDGVLVVDPDGIGPFFEVPIAGPLPETLNFIP